MADLSAAVQDPTAGNIVTPTYSAVSAADKFIAVAHGRYMLHYKNGAAAGTAASYVAEKVALAPAGSVPTGPAGSTKWSDLQVIGLAGLGTSAERVVVIDDITPYIDNLGFVNLIHNGTITNLTVFIAGPLS